MYLITAGAQPLTSSLFPERRPSGEALLIKLTQPFICRVKDCRGEDASPKLPASPAPPWMGDFLAHLRAYWTLFLQVRGKHNGIRSVPLCNSLFKHPVTNTGGHTWDLLLWVRVCYVNTPRVNMLLYELPLHPAALH